MLLGKAVMINWTDVAPEHRAQYDAWHCHEHMVGRVTIPGFQRGRRYQAVHARRDFLTMYEVDDLNVLTGKEYLAKANAPSELTLRTTPLVKNSIRGLVNVRASFGIGTGGHVLTLRFGPRAGRLRMLAVTGTQRSSQAPEMPTMIESGLSGFDVRAWFAVMAPARTPRDIVQKLNVDINKILSDATIRTRLSNSGVELIGGTPQQADAFIRAEMARWPKIIKVE